MSAVIDELCPSCSHEWYRHDPADGRCDAYPGGDHCDPSAVVVALSKRALLDKADQRGREGE